VGITYAFGCACFWRREYVSNTTLLFTVLIVGNNVMMIMEQMSEEIRKNKLVAVGGSSETLPFVKIKRTNFTI
jgi:hypothetical protein